MTSVSLPPRTWIEWFQAYYILPKTNPQKIKDLCTEMEKELGQVAVERDIGELGALLAQFATISYSDDDDGTFHISDGKHQEYANLYREFEKRFSKLEKQESELNLYLGKNENADADIINKRDFLTIKMDETRRVRSELLANFNKLDFTPYNRIFLSAAYVFIIAPTQKISSIFKTRKIETLALGSFAAIAGYSVMTNTNTSFLVKATVPLFFMYIGHLLSKTYYKLNEQPAQSQTFSITTTTPPGSPRH
ncbi:MAG: hypothetical protein KR126chlam4_00326 [Candidatus Anoxychlamydiales bacterium]|nr:hypothetical protein [Candidatus Anoxychlamydiales bacterium]NGX40504.1 hypothetical protein [Candidatus Anoxychlamydiales bacterium]HEU64312.1 hypothetical protein [Chlamydiota bacterium]